MIQIIFDATNWVRLPKMFYLLKYNLACWTYPLCILQHPTTIKINLYLVTFNSNESIHCIVESRPNITCVPGFWLNINMHNPELTNRVGTFIGQYHTASGQHSISIIRLYVAEVALKRTAGILHYTLSFLPVTLIRMNRGNKTPRDMLWWDFLFSFFSYILSRTSFAEFT